MLKSKLMEESSKISKNTIIHGSVQTEKSIVIQGEVLGYVASDNQIKITEDGSVQNSIKGKNCVLYGAVSGDVEAENEIIIGSEARIEGNLICKKLRIEQGATLELFRNIVSGVELLAKSEGINSDEDSHSAEQE